MRWEQTAAEGALDHTGPDRTGPPSLSSVSLASNYSGGQNDQNTSV